MKYLTALLFLAALQCEAQQVKVTDYSSLEKHLKEQTDTLQVVNFWASWCAPCIAEMKYFKEAQEKFSGKKVKFVYVSLDFVKSMENVKKTIRKHGMAGVFFLLKDNPDEYINKIDENWQGQIPITLIVRKDGSYKVHMSAFSNFEELNTFIQEEK